MRNTDAKTGVQFLQVALCLSSSLGSVLFPHQGCNPRHSLLNSWDLMSHTNTHTHSELLPASRDQQWPPFITILLWDSHVSWLLFLLCNFFFNYLGSVFDCSLGEMNVVSQQEISFSLVQYYCWVYQCHRLLCIIYIYSVKAASISDILMLPCVKILPWFASNISTSSSGGQWVQWWEAEVHHGRIWCNNSVFICTQANRVIP